jgi:quinol monooxygenase YgiN
MLSKLEPGNLFYAAVTGGKRMNIRRMIAILAVCSFMLGVLEIKSPAQSENKAITLTAKLTIKAGKEKEFETLMKGIVPKVRQEPGNLAYIMCRSKDNPRLFLFFEEYADQAAVQAHGKHFRELGLDLSSFLDGPVVAEYYDKIAP